ncbi:hypothetical protein IKG07_02950 [Candidatus Saccharibacteria bacterium]|nr:hypothetical protein [Candidatus Saccharibacteria bacterium]
MNEFYHEFSVGFNWWYVLLPLQCVLMIAFGASNLHLNKRNNRIMRWSKSNTATNILAAIMMVILTIVMIVESASGVIQMLDNHLGPEDDPMWSLIMFTFGVPVVAAFIYCIFVELSVFGQKLKRKYLRKVRQQRTE